MDRPVVAIIQARAGSTRLPGKVLAPVLGRPLLTFMLERVAAATRLDDVVVATTREARDDMVAELAAAAGVTVFRGSEDDVLERYRAAAEQVGAGTVVRLTADCPLIAPDVIDDVIAAYADGQRCDLVTNAPPTGRTYPDGMDVEVFSRTALERAVELATEDADREHVTRRLQRPPFSARTVDLDEDLGWVRVTVDYAEDLERVRTIAEALAERHPHFSLDDVLAQPAARETSAT